MQISDQLVNQMLRNLPQDQQNIMAGILKNDITHEVTCDSQDVYKEVEVPLKDDDDNPVLYKTGEKKGQPKIGKKKVLDREGVKGRVIAYIYRSGQVVPVPTESGFVFLRSSRRRTDGELGFESWCGTDSRIAPNEMGILKANGVQPSKEDLYKMAENLQKQPPKYATINGERHVDGFIIREVRK